MSAPKDLSKQSNEKELEESKKSVMQVSKTELESLAEVRKLPVIRGYDFNQGVDYHQIFRSYARTGFQASSFAKAVEIVEQMIRWRLSDEKVDPV
jgi:deoxyhypusine synthase